MAARRSEDEPAPPPKADPLLGVMATPSMKATRKYFFVVIGLMLLQIGMGVITAHYAVEGQRSSVPLAEMLPYWSRRTCTRKSASSGLQRRGLRRACTLPRCSRAGTKLQKLGVDVLFWARSSSWWGPVTGWLGTCSTRASTSGSGSATRDSNTRVWAVSGSCCSSRAFCSGCSCWAAPCGRH